MTNKEAIEILNQQKYPYPEHYKDIEVNEALDLAIKALEERPQGEWICPNCDLYEYAEDDYCQYAGECTIGCRECGYFMQKGSAE